MTKEEKQSILKKRKRPLHVFIGFVVIGLLSVLWWAVVTYQNRQAMESAQMGQEIPTVEVTDNSHSLLEIRTEQDESGNTIYYVNGVRASDRPYFMGEDRFIYNGKTYQRNGAVKAYLIMGVDNRESLQLDRDITEIGLSDGMFLVAENTVDNTVKIIQIPRDTMTMVDTTNEKNEVIGSELNHVNYAWTYGDGHQLSGEFSKKAVTGLFAGLSLDGFMAGSIDIISTLNDIVGGVTVEIQQDDLTAADSSFIKGEKVNLTGRQAERFVRYRDVNGSFTAISRMDRQRQYAIAFERALMEQQKGDHDTISDMFSSIEENIITDMDKGEYLKIALDIYAGGELLGEEDFFTPKGTNKKGEKYDEFYPDYTDIDKLAMELFFREI